MSKFSMSSTSTCLRQRRLLGRLGAAQALAYVFGQDVGRLDAELGELVPDSVYVDVSHSCSLKMSEAGLAVGANATRGVAQYGDATSIMPRRIR